MINYVWNTNPCDCVISEDGMTDVIQTVHWRLTGTDENGTSSDVYGAQSFPAPTEEGFIPFDQCCQSVVVGWLSSVLDVPAIEKQIADSIYLINNPVMVQLNLPTSPEEEVIAVPEGKEEVNG
jgi:hypothetical protein